MRSFVVAVMAAVTLAGCEQAQLGVEDAWVRLPAVSSRPGAAYFTVKGGSEATSLLGVSSPAAVRTELHEMKHENGMMTMSPLKNTCVVIRSMTSCMTTVLTSEFAKNGTDKSMAPYNDKLTSLRKLSVSSSRNESGFASVVPVHRYIVS